MDADRAHADAGPLAGLVVAGDVEHDLVAVDVGVVVGHRDRERVVVDLARHEVAHHEVVALEDLVHRRRLVHPAGDRLVVGDVERVRVEAAVPADHVERVPRHDVDGAGEPARPGAAVLDEDLDRPLRLAPRVLTAPAGRARSTARARAAGRTATGSASAGRCGCSPRCSTPGRRRSAPSGASSRAARSGSRRCRTAGARTPSRARPRRTRRTRTRRPWRCGTGATCRRRPRRRCGRRRCRAPAGGRSRGRAPQRSRTGRAASGAGGAAARSASVDWSGRSQVRASTTADGTPTWYSSEESEEKPSSPISSSQ